MERYIGNSELTIGEKLNQLRKDKKFTLEQVEKSAQISKSTISNYENGSTSPTYENLHRLLEVYKVSFREFCGLDLVKYERDLEVFKAYGLNETIFRELMMSARYGLRNMVADCINLIFDYPLHALRLFDELNDFFDLTKHETISQLLMDFQLFKYIPNGTEKRIMLEPVIQTLSRIYDAKYSKEIAERFKSEVERYQQTRAQAVRAAPEYKAIMQKLNDDLEKADG